jgi:predicted P-loop ATPase
VDVGGKLKLDAGGIARDRDQIWAEALVRYRKGEPYLLNADENSLAVEEQTARMVYDEWEGPILEFLTSGAGTTRRDANNRSRSFDRGVKYQRERHGNGGE